MDTSGREKRKILSEPSPPNQFKKKPGHRSATGLTGNFARKKFEVRFSSPVSYRKKDLKRDPNYSSDRWTKLSFIPFVYIPVVTAVSMAYVSLKGLVLLPYSAGHFEGRMKFEKQKRQKITYNPAKVYFTRHYRSEFDEKTSTYLQDISSRIFGLHPGYEKKTRGRKKDKKPAFDRREKEIWNN